MKREIKFRAWDNGTKKWLLGYEYPNLGGFSLFGECMLMGEWGHILNNYILDYEAHGHNEGDLVVMQYTGLKDKNGDEIYEGDIKRWQFNSCDRYYVCYWSDIDCGFRWRLIKHNEKQSDSDIEIPFDTEKDYYKYVIKINQRDNGFDSWSTIIGNIYENPELI